MVWVLGEVFFFLAEAGSLIAVADVVGGGLEVALAHEFFLDHVLDVLDVDEGGVATADAVGDAFCDVNSGFWIFLDGEEGFANGDLDLGLGPWDDVAIAADEADGQGVRADVDIDGAGFFHGSAECEGFGDVVGFVFEQGFFDEEVEVSFGKAEAAIGLERGGEEGCDGVGDV